MGKWCRVFGCSWRIRGRTDVVLGSKGFEGDNGNSRVNNLEVGVD